MDVQLNDRFIGEVLLGPRTREILLAIAHIAQELYQSEVAKRTGLLAASAHGYTEIGGVQSDRWIGVMQVGGAGAAGTASYAASHEFGAGNHGAADAVEAEAGKAFGTAAKQGSTGGHHNRAAKDLNRVLEQLGSL